MRSRRSEHPMPHPILELATAFQRSQTLFTLVALDLPSRLDGRERRLADLAWEVRLHPLPFDRLVNAGVALGLLERSGDRVRNAPIAQRYLVRGLPEYLGEVVKHHDEVVAERWRHLDDDLAEWQPGTPGESDGSSTPSSAELDSLRAHHNLNRLMGDRLARIEDFSRHRRLLDLGGGTGAVAIAFCERYANLSAEILDRALVARLARAYVRRSGLQGRIRVRTADLIADDPPAGFDLVLLSNVLSTFSASDSRDLLVRVHDRLEPGGTVLLCGWMLNARRHSPLLGVLFCLNDVAWHAPDVERSGATYTRWLRAAGFEVAPRRTVLPPWSVLIARKPRTS
jgi:SAM-dependent methyltransferase